MSIARVWCAGAMRILFVGQIDAASGAGHADDLLQGVAADGGGHRLQGVAADHEIEGVVGPGEICGISDFEGDRPAVSAGLRADDRFGIVVERGDPVQPAFFGEERFEVAAAAADGGYRMVRDEAVPAQQGAFVRPGGPVCAESPLSKEPPLAGVPRE